MACPGRAPLHEADAGSPSFVLLTAKKGRPRVCSAGEKQCMWCTISGLCPLEEDIHSSSYTLLSPCTPGGIPALIITVPTVKTPIAFVPLKPRNTCP